MILDTMLSWFGADRIVNGTVVKKTHYPATSVSIPTGKLVGNQFVAGNTTESYESWTLTVRGKGRFGSKVEEEIQVDPSVWSSIEPGDAYGPTH